MTFNSMKVLVIFLASWFSLSVVHAQAADRLKLTKTIPLAGVKGRFDHPESFQLEQNGNRIFVNVPDAKHIAVVDRQKRIVIATWPMEKFRANFPMALDGSESPFVRRLSNTVAFGRLRYDHRQNGDRP